MSELLRYSVPFYLLGKELTGPITRGSGSDVMKVYRGFVGRMNPGPIYHGWENLPSNARFVLAANHYQRRGLWIAHAAAAVGMAMAERYRCDPPVRWIVTANWPRWQVGGWSIPSPGDLILPRVAKALWCYAVPFAGSNPKVTAASLRRLLRESGDLQCPLGVFPEGAQATAGNLRPALPGVGRFLTLMARRGWPVLPVGVSENGRFIVRFGQAIAAERVAGAKDAGETVMRRIGELVG